MSKSTIHLTLTGYRAGLPICQQRKNEHDEYVHAMYAPESILKSGRLCPKCKAILDNVDREIAEEKARLKQEAENEPR